MKDENILKRLIDIQKDLPKKQRIVCNYIIENYQDLSVLSLPDLAEKIGVAQTTVVRFIKNVGYDSYKDFRKQFHYYTIENTQPTWWHLERSFTHSNHQQETLNQAWQEIMNLLEKSVTPQMLKNFNKAVKLILDSKAVNIVGFRTSKAAAYYFEYMLIEFYPKVRQLSSDSEFVYDRLLQLDKDNVVVIIAISPYTKLTIDVAEYCHHQKIPVILITDHLSCPASSYATCILNVKSSEVQYSIVPVIALIEALVIEIGKKTSEYSIKHLNKLNKLLNDKKITIS